MERLSARGRSQRRKLEPGASRLGADINPNSPPSGFRHRALRYKQNRQLGCTNLVEPTGSPGSGRTTQFTGTLGHNPTIMDELTG